MTHTPQCALGKVQPERFSKEEASELLWRNHGTLVINVNHPDLSWPDREWIMQLGNAIYGPTKVAK